MRLTSSGMEWDVEPALVAASETSCVSASVIVFTGALRHTTVTSTFEATRPSQLNSRMSNFTVGSPSACASDNC
jgi:hypothetical protein